MMESASTEQAFLPFEQCPIPLITRESTGRITGFNNAFVQLVGHSAAQGLLDLNPESLPDHPLYPLLEDRKLIVWTGSDDLNMYFEAYDFALSDSDTTRARLLVDVSRQVQLNEANHKLVDELEQHVMTDPLTGLLNRRGVVLALEPQVARSRRYNSAISVIALHVGSTTQRNDLIVEIARLLKDQLRWADLIGRTNQHGLILVLPETNAQAAVKLAEKIQVQVDDVIQRFCPGETMISSFGITEWRKVDNATSLISRAEDALALARENDSRHSLAV